MSGGESALAKSALVIAYGNPLRSDDGLAWHVAPELEDRFANQRVDVRCVQQLMPEMSEIISRSQLVVFIDAATGGVAGEVRCEPIGEEIHAGGGSHQLTPAGCVALARALYGSKPLAFAVTVCGESFDHGEALSPAVAGAIPEVVKTIAGLVVQFT